MRNDKGEIVCNICGEPATAGEFTVIRFEPGEPMEIFDLCEDCEKVIRRTVLCMMGEEE